MAKLPIKPNEVGQVDPSKLSMLVIGEPKVGKTTWASSDDDALIIAFERGHSFCRGFIFDVIEWDKTAKKVKRVSSASKDNEGTAMEVVALLQNTDRFKRVIIDTADACAKMISDWWCRENGYEDLSDAKWGKGWESGLSKPLRKFANDIGATGRPITWLTHSKKDLERTAKSEKIYKESTLPSGAQKVIVPAVDIIMHMVIGKKNPSTGEPDRIMISGSDEGHLAGNRMSDKMHLPPKYISSKENGWTQFCKLVTNKEYADKADRRFKATYK